MGVAATAQALENLLREGRQEFAETPWTAAPAAAAGKIRRRQALQDRVRVRAERRPAARRSANWSKASSATTARRFCLGVTGSGKTFTMAKVIEATQRPALILAPNKTLAAQLYGEFKSFFPDNAVEYFVSYYDYYQPEAYVPRTDTYIEKESSINEQIDRMRHSATRALLERDDVIIVASVSCIYGIGSVETYSAMTFTLKQGGKIEPAPIARRPGGAAIQAHAGRFLSAARSACAATSSRSSRRITRTAPGASRCSATRSNRSTNSIRSPGKRPTSWNSSRSTPTRITSRRARRCIQAIQGIKHELRSRLDQLNAAGRLLEAQRLEQRTVFDLEMMEATGSCAGIENYSRYLTGRKTGRAAADSVRIRARQRAGVRRREPRHHPAARRHVPRRLPPQGDAGRIRLPPALLHGQPPAALRGMGRHAAADHGGVGHAQPLGDERGARRVRRAGDPPDRADRSAGRNPPGAHAGRRPGRRSAAGGAERLPRARSPC